MREDRGPQEIIDATRRAVILAALLEMMRTLSLEYHGASSFGVHADDVILRAAVFIGQADGRRMNVSKLAEYCGIPRPTAIRKLNAMLKNDLLRKDADGLFYVPVSRANSDSILNMARKLRSIMMVTCEKLHKMDVEPA